jgi:hypothetical protein
MTAYAHSHPAFELRASDRSGEHEAAHLHMVIRPSGDGWSLMTDDGVVVFRGLGLSSRRECLRRARELGALSVRG